MVAHPNIAESYVATKSNHHQVLASESWHTWTAASFLLPLESATADNEFIQEPYDMAKTMVLSKHCRLGGGNKWGRASGMGLWGEVLQDLTSFCCTKMYTVSGKKWDQ